VFHLALHTIITGTREGAADFNTVNGGNYEASGPIRAEYSIALQLTGEITAESENGTGILPFEGVPDGIFTERANAFRESTSLAFRFDPVHGGKLTSGTQKHRVKDLFAVVSWRLAAIGQSAHFRGEIKHLIEIGLERVPAQGSALLFFLPFTLKKTAQIDLANDRGCLLKTAMQLHLGARFFGQLRGDVKGLQLAVQEHGNLKRGVQPFAIRTMASRLSAFAPALDKGTGQHLA